MLERESDRHSESEVLATGGSVVEHTELYRSTQEGRLNVVGQFFSHVNSIFFIIFLFVFASFFVGCLVFFCQF